MRNPDYYHKGLPYLDGFDGIYAPKQAVQLDAIRADRAAGEFRGYPPSAMDQLKSDLGDKIVMQSARLELRLAGLVQPHEKAVRRRAGAPRADLGDRPLGQRPGAVQDRHSSRPSAASSSPARRLAPNKDELSSIAGFWPDIEKSRAEAKRLLKEAGAEGLEFRAAEPQRRPALQV